MSIMELIAGIMLIIACVAITGIVLVQDSKGQGLSSVIMGSDMMAGESRVRSKDARQARFTRIAAIVFFVLTIAVNVISVFSK